MSTTESNSPGASLRLLTPSWVAADPLSVRAVDALGLQLTADQIAEALLPGLSVATTRARYYSLLAWARRECGKRADEGRIHRLEVALAIREASLHPREQLDDGGNSCRFIGSRNLPRRPNQTPLDTPPRDPRSAYKVPVWRAYRASMQSLGLLDGEQALTDDGTKLANRFSAACRPVASGRKMLPASACLSELTAMEATLLSRALGVWRKGKSTNDPSDAGRRGALEREIRPLLSDQAHPHTILAPYETVRARTPSDTVAALREAAIWERLSVGLGALFLLRLQSIDRGAPGSFASQLRSARRQRNRKLPPLGAIEIDEGAATSAIESVRRALALRDRLGEDAVSRCDESAFALGESLVGAGSLDHAIDQLDARHVMAKAEEAWFRRVGGRLELARDADRKWRVPTNVPLHGYRLGAFGRILADLRRARR